jgi:hypothetical protein
MEINKNTKLSKKISISDIIVLLKDKNFSDNVKFFNYLTHLQIKEKISIKTIDKNFKTLKKKVNYIINKNK